MKITQKILKNIIKDIIKEETDPEQSFAPPVSAEQLRQEPIAAYIMQTLNRQWPTLASQSELDLLLDRVAELETRANNNVAPLPSADTLRKENKKRKHNMKISKTTIQKIIKEEVAKIIKEKYQPSSDDPPHKVNSIRVQELQAKLAHAQGEIDQLYDLIEEYLLTPIGVGISRASAPLE